METRPSNCCRRTQAAVRLALVTGVSPGIGFEVASLLAARGYRTFGTSRSPEGNKGPTGVEMLRLDVTSDESASAAVNDS